MKNQFIVANDGTPIVLIFSENYTDWLENQTALTRNWLSSTKFDGKGFRIIPSTDGTISSVVYGIARDVDYFVAGDLPTLLPEGQYQLSELPVDLSSSDAEKLTLDFAITWGLASYSYDRYKKESKTLPVLALSSQKLIDDALKVITSISLVRDMINCPASDLMPQDISKIVDGLAQDYSGIQVKHIVGDELLKQNFPTIHAVGRASIHEPRLIDFTWGDPAHPKVTLVGKGVCFDSGGLDLKPASAMRNMKKDMGGSAHVLGLASLIIQHNLPVRLRVLIPAVENAVSSNAFRPGDVLTTRQGITVEIDNTDAEGRLVLCDALTEADSESPEIIIDFATLTGACRVALGTELPGFFSNNDEVAVNLNAGSVRAKDPIWRLPLFKPYQAMLNSNIADTVNSADTPFGGAITAALYLEMFVSKETPWVHFDVMAWNNRKLPGRPIGGEAFGIRAVFDYLQAKYSA
jgi:leucyl aminopeptidase